MKGTLMYVPSHFEEYRPEQLHALIAHHPLGIPVTNGPDGLDANHLPFELETRGDSPGILHTHVARANPVWQDIGSGDEVPIGGLVTRS
jgi:transcriptional regulator